PWRRRQLCPLPRRDRRRGTRARHLRRSLLGRAAPGANLRAGESGSAAHGHRRRGADPRGETDRRRLPRRAPYLQPRPRHHAPGRPRSCPPPPRGDPRLILPGGTIAGAWADTMAGTRSVPPEHGSGGEILRRLHLVIGKPEALAQIVEIGLLRRRAAVHGCPRREIELLRGIAVPDLAQQLVERLRIGEFALQKLPVLRIGLL